MTRRAIVVGAGGHARVILSLLAAAGTHEVVGVLDTGVPRSGERIMGIPVLGQVDELARVASAGVDVYLAIGENAARRDLWSAIRAQGYALPSLISPAALIDPTAVIGASVVICARAFVGPEVVVGDNTLVNTGSILEHEARLGSHSHLASLATIAGRSRVGDRCFVGAGATIIDRVKVTDDVVIGAGGVVVADITAPGLYVGVPARSRTVRTAGA